MAMGTRMVLATSVTLAVLDGGAGVARAENSVHVVASGETLWGISRAHGCEVAQLRRSNQIASSVIRAGQTLQIPNCDRAAPVDEAPALAAAERHTVVAGDTLGAIADRYQSTVAAIMADNQLDSTVIRVGQVLSVSPGIASTVPRIVGPLLGQSIGSPNSGHLTRAVQLPHDPAYYRRRPERAFGATHVVRQVFRTVRAVRDRYPKTHRLAIGDFSIARGGRITMHSSHQSGRDVDLGFYFRKRPPNYPEEFAVVTAGNIDFDANWMLLTRLAATANSPSGVERIFMSYSTQKIFYQLAAKRGVAKERLRSLFQYPRGQSAAALITHEPGHDEHIHVRFKCPPNDRKCS